MNSLNNTNQPLGAVLEIGELRALCQATPSLVEPYEEGMLQPNGLELSLESVAGIEGRGRLGVNSTDRVLPDYHEIEPGPDGWWHLPPGAYRIRYREYVRIPGDLCAIARPRSSILRMGAQIGTALWDSGYEGRSESLLVVSNPSGMDLQRGARVLQLVFLRLGRQAGTLYNGKYQGENR